MQLANGKGQVDRHADSSSRHGPPIPIGEKSLTSGRQRAYGTHTTLGFCEFKNIPDFRSRCGTLWKGVADIQVYMTPLRQFVSAKCPKLDRYISGEGETEDMLKTVQHCVGIYLR